MSTPCALQPPLQDRALQVPLLPLLPVTLNMLLLLLLLWLTLLPSHL
jgi:hypothetical protein